MTPTSQSKEEMTALADELERDYPAVDVTTTVFSRDFAGVGCCVIPQDRVLAIVTALRALPQQPATGTASAAVEFVKWAMREGPWEGGSLDGDVVQDKAEGLGLIVKTAYDPKKHGERGEFKPGDDFYEFSPTIAAPSPSSIELDGGVRDALEPFVGKLAWPMQGLADTDVIQCNVITPDYESGGIKRAFFGLTVGDFTRLAAALASNPLAGGDAK